MNSGLQLLIGATLSVVCYGPAAAKVYGEPRAVDCPTRLKRTVSLKFTLEPDGGPWSASDDGRTYENELYRLSVREKPLDVDVTTLDIRLRRKDGETFTLIKCESSAALAAARIQRIWPSSRLCQRGGNVCADLDHWGEGAQSHACSHDPVVMALSSCGANIGTMGMAWTAPETRMVWTPLPNLNAEWKREYRFSFSRPMVEGMPLVTREYHDGFYLSEKPESWYASMRRYAAFVDQWRGYAPRKPSPWSLSPCLSLGWTLWPPPGLDKKQKGWMQKIIEEQAPLAKEMGFDIIHLEADALAYDLHYEPSETAFSDFGAVKEKLAGLGMILEMHFSVPFIHEGDPDYESLKAFIMTTDTQPGGVRAYEHDDILCPRTREMRQHLVECVEHMARDMGVRSFWVDFCDDSVPVKACTAKHEHAWNTLGEGWDAQLRAFTGAAWTIDPRITFITRRSIANINNKPYMTHMCAFDCEYDQAQQRREAVFIRSFGSGIVPYAFHVVWADSEPDTEVAMHMASCSLLMVPVICQDLSRLSPGHLDVVKAWLDFHREHAEDIIHGDLEPLVFMPPSAALRVERNRKAFVSCFETVPGTIPLRGKPSEVFLFNGVAKDFSTMITGVAGTFEGQWLDYRLRPYGASFEVSAQNGRMIVSGDCPVLPCMIRLKQK